LLRKTRFQSLDTALCRQLRCQRVACFDESGCPRGSQRPGMGTQQMGLYPLVVIPPLTPFARFLPRPHRLPTLFRSLTGRHGICLHGHRLRPRWDVLWLLCFGAVLLISLSVALNPREKRS
jgi:hypothetical protein